uniref:Histidine kinase n=1 Tax=uncultured marine thaumarchaeote KM3_56_F06 TaxID=1456204 RepID=A0A075H9I0_9ARCH|nr:histidine kinase [uncultured marine thaumarchaeote KM3_56_F06]
MKTESKIIFGGSSLIIITIIIGGIFSILLSDEVNNSAIKNAEAVNSAFILSIAKNQLNENNFRADMSENNNQVFDEFFQKMKTKEMLRIKVWDNEGTIVYSDDKSIIGSNYGDNLRFKKQ